MTKIRSALDVAMAREVPAPPPPSALPSGRQFDEWELRYGWAGWEILADLYGDRGYDWQQVSVVRSAYWAPAEVTQFLADAAKVIPRDR